MVMDRLVELAWNAMFFQHFGRENDATFSRTPSRILFSASVHTSQ